MSPFRYRPRVLVTRARDQGSVLARHLEALGADPILLPLIAIEPPSSFCALDSALDALNSFDWIVFTSSNAVSAAARRASLRGIGLDQATAGLRIAAIGAATAAKLAQQGLALAVVSPEPVAESLADALVPFARAASGRPARFLLPRAEDARDTLPGALAAAGGEVTLAPAYRNVVPPGALTEIRRLFTPPASPPEAIAFTSSSTARNFFVLLAEAGLPLHPSTLLASIGPITSMTLQSFGYSPHLEAETATVAALAEAIMQRLEERER